MKKSLFFLLSALLCIACGRTGGVADQSLLPVGTGGRFGYINHTGEFVINPQFDGATRFYDDIARVKKNGKYGFIRKDGSYLCPPVYEDATIFSEGIAWTVKEKEEPVAIDKKGRELFTAKGVSYVRNFSEGLASFVVTLPEGDVCNGYMDKKGNVVIPPSYRWAGSFSNGLAAVADKYLTYGYINKKGDLVIDYQFSDAGMFDENGRAIVKSKKDNLYGTIDQKGNYKINPQFAEMSADGDNYVIKMGDNGDYGYCDKKGKIIINPQFKKMYFFHDSDLCPVNLNGEFGYINKKGKLVINPQFTGAIQFMGDIAAVLFNDKIGFIDKKGHFVINPQFTDTSNDFGIFTKEELEGWTSFTIVESQYMDINKVTENIKQLLNKGKLDGMTFPPSVGEILQHYQIEEKEVPTYTSWEVKDWHWGKDLLAYLILDGYFYSEVSDGWWGTKSVLNKKSQVESISLKLSLEGINWGRASELQEGLQNAFKGKHENFKLGFKCKDNNTVIVSISK